MKKNIFSKFSSQLIETTFWFVLIAISIFLNISSQIFIKTHPIFFIIFIIAFVVIVLSKIWSYAIKSLVRRVILIACFILVIFVPFVLIMTENTNKTVLTYYLPALIAISIASLVVIDPRLHVVAIAALSVFFLGDAFFGIYVATEGVIKYPALFLRIFSLTLLTIFTYYFYKKEIFMRTRLNSLNERLRELDRLKSEFIANVSHELRTPLTSIKNSVVLLEKIRKNEAVSMSEEELFSIIFANLNRQANLIDTLLDLSKIESGKLGMVRTLVNINKVIKDVVNSLVVQARAKNIEILIDTQPDLPQIYAAEDRLAQVYTNLLDNAIKYNKKDGKVFIKVRSTEKGIESIIEDTGVGIAPENIGKLFEKFRRFEVTEESRGKSVGLGLVIAKEIIDLHGGTIRVESKLNKGTSFIVTLPAGLRAGDERLLKK